MSEVPYISTNSTKDDFVYLVVLIAKHMGAVEQQELFDMLDAIYIDELQSTDPEVFHDISLLVEITKLGFSHHFSEYLLNYEPFMLSYPSLDQARRALTWTRLKHDDWVKGIYLLTAQDKKTIRMLGTELSEIHSSLASYDESLDYWSPKEPEWLKEAVINQREAKLAELGVLKSLYAELTAKLTADFH